MEIVSNLKAAVLMGIVGYGFYISGLRIVSYLFFALTAWFVVRAIRQEKP